MLKQSSLCTLPTWPNSASKRIAGVPARSPIKLPASVELNVLAGQSLRFKAVVSRYSFGCLELLDERQVSRGST